MNNKQIVCDSCGFYRDEFFINKHKSGKNYCWDCKLIISGISPNDLRPISQEEFNKMLLVALNTPPLKLKDLKKRLKKERESKNKDKLKKKLISSKRNSKDK